MTRKTALHNSHQNANAQLVDFAGWDMPMHYGSQIQEHHYVRQDAGMFDVSHMGVLDVNGAGARDFLRYCLANDVAKLKTPGRALYTCLLNDQAGIIDDLIVYYLADEHYRIVLNASRRDVDVSWLQQHASNFDVDLHLHDDLAIIAVQGPNAVSKVINVLGTEWQAVADLKPFSTLIQRDMQIARTGYTGEDGVEMIVPAVRAPALWQQLEQAGVKPCGLGARDTLRLEAGMNLYGLDMDENCTPLNSNLTWTVALQDATRDFIGKAALLATQAQGVDEQLVGLVMLERGVLRNHQAVFAAGQQVGEITSGSFSPSLNQAIAFARLKTPISAELYVERRGKAVPVKKVKAPFVRFGEKVYTEA